MKKVGWLMGVWCFLVVTGIAMAVEPQTQEKPGPLTMVTEVITPSYISPSELLDFLGVTTSGGVNSFFCDFPNHDRPVQIRCNDAANLVMLTGVPEDITVVKELIKSADIPPRQIIIETQIIELDNRRLDDLGIDWEDLLRSSGLTLYHNYNRDKVSRDQKDKAKSGPMTSEHETEQTLTQTSKDTRVSGVNSGSISFSTS